MKIFASLSLLLASTLGISTPLSQEVAMQSRIQAEKSMSGKVILKIYNSDDYILHDVSSGDSLIRDFEKYVWDKDHVNLKVVYSVFPTNEEMLSRIQTGAAQYDLICTSDYVIQKMISTDMVEAFTVGEERKQLYGNNLKDWNDNYSHYTSKYLLDYFETIKAHEKTGDIVPLSKYARGYMWGTLGLTYNPDYYVFKDRNMSSDKVKYDLDHWTSLWNEDYKGTYQIKDSMRDTYALGLMKSFDPLLRKMKLAYDSGKISEQEYTKQQNIVFNNINYLEEFNKLDKTYMDNHKDYSIQEIVDMVQNSLSTLKKNCYGLEVDSGKTDITTGNKSGIGLAWSGDAITSLNGADELNNSVKLYYSIPNTGGNIWFDGWIMQKYDGLNKEYAQKFIDFISDPINAKRNMEYIGYTSFIAGEGIRDLTRELYDPRLKQIYVYDKTTDEYLRDEEDNLILKTSKKGIQKEEIDGEIHEIDYGTKDMTGSCLFDDTSKDKNNLGFMKIDGERVEWSKLAEELNWTLRDLSYFFNDESFGDEIIDRSSKFYSDEIEDIEYIDKDGVKHEVQVGRQFLAQYPSKVKDNRSSTLNQIPGLAVMEDYRDNNIYVLKMWENFKSGGALNWTIVSILIIELSIATSLGIYFTVKKNTSKKLRKKRRKDKK